MITGAHSIIYSTNAEADRNFLRDVLKLPNVDVGHGWLIFGLPPAEIAVHPSENNTVHEFYFMCEDIDAFVAEMKKHDIACDPCRIKARFAHADHAAGRREARGLSTETRTTGADEC